MNTLINHIIQPEDLPVKTPFLGLDIDHDGSRIAITGRTEYARCPIVVLDAVSGHELARMRCGSNTDCCFGAVFTRGGDLLSIERSRANTLRLLKWNISEDSVSYYSLHESDGQLFDLVLSSDESMLLIMGREVQLYDWPTLHCRARIPISDVVPLNGAVACFDANNKNIWVYGAEPSQVTEYTLDGMLTGRQLSAPSVSGKAVVCSPDGENIVLVGRKGTIIKNIWSNFSIESIHFSTLSSHWGGFTRDSAFYIYMFGGPVIFNIKQRTVQHLEHNGLGRTQLARFNPNRSMLAAIMDEYEVVWSTIDHTLLSG